MRCNFQGFCENIIKSLDSLFSELAEKINGKIENAANIFEAKNLFQETLGFFLGMLKIYY